MKTKLLLTCILFVISLLSCKKGIQLDNKVSNSNQSNYSSDGLLSIQVSIAPPVTQSMFLANSPDGSVSYSAYDVVAGMKIVNIDGFHVAAPYPIVSALLQGPNKPQQPAFFSYNAQLFPRKSLNLPFSILYNSVDSSTSPTVVTCTLKDVEYHTEDWVYHTLTVDNISGRSFSMCLVNNIAHLTFQAPPYKVLSNGSIEIAEVHLKGDTSWTLNSLPINFYFPDFNFGTYPNKLTLKANGKVIARDSVESIYTHQATFKIKGGFKHVAGQEEVLKIYGYNMSVQLPSFFITEIGDLNNFIWVDGLGGVIGGKLNGKYYIEDTGEAVLHNY